ncbi:hypothetical protein ANTPLA_LOCUS10859 [Anthophora plagiata]
MEHFFPTKGFNRNPIPTANGQCSQLHGIPPRGVKETRESARMKRKEEVKRRKNKKKKKTTKNKEIKKERREKTKKKKKKRRRGKRFSRSPYLTKQLDLRSEHAGNVHATWPGFPWPNRFTPVLPLVRKHTNAVVQPLPPP